MNDRGARAERRPRAGRSERDPLTSRTPDAEAAPAPRAQTRPGSRPGLNRGRPRPLSPKTKPLTREQKRAHRVPEAPIDQGPGTRLQRVLAAAGIGSRRRCEELIEEGRVKVNGRVVERLPAWVEPTEDVIEVEGHVLPRPEAHVYVMFYKPRRTMCTLSDPEGRRTVADMVKHPTSARIYPVGRLDYDTMGLLLLTNDGEIANRLTHARYRVSKVYRALVKGTLTVESVAELERRLRDQETRFRRIPSDRRTKTRRPSAGAPADLALRSERRTDPDESLSLRLAKAAPDKAVIDLTLTDAPTRPVEEMLDDVGLRVKKLVRVRVGPLRLTSVTLGMWRDLTRDELRELRIACGLERAPKRAAAAKKPGAKSSAKQPVKAPRPRRDDDGFNLILPGDSTALAARPAPPAAAEEEFDLDGDSVW
ncbi:MAG: pseudouridine synthase [Phycisphaerales bacterium]